MIDAVFCKVLHAIGIPKTLSVYLRSVENF